MKILAICAAKDRTALMVGPSGTGKTTGIEWLAQKTGNKHLIVNLDGQSTVSSLIGGLKARNGSTVWEDGPVLYAMRHGIWLILDEIDFCDPSVLARLHGILQHGERHLFLAEANGETVVAHSGFRIFATANSLGLFDDDSLASGTNAMNFAFLRRWTVIQCNYPTVAQEVKRLACHGHADTVCSAIAKASDTVRKLIESRTLRGYWGTAHSMDFASWAMDLDSWEDGFIVSATGKFSPAEVRIAWEAIQRDCPAGSPRNPAITASATV
jgi:cobaltochelatase CobS